ncbi:alpha/beta fold hydrolase [Microbacterium sp. 179-I 3D4 NHS]|uniref:alpha/beta fold hydrolase n=1 Tax=Microbacterium sp. 179-I 3D4 NHS TaxID=3142381 RepID=UPI0039A2629B
MVLVHGIGMSHRYLSRLHDVLAERTRVLSVDLPGFGGLPKPRRDLDVTEMADAMIEVIRSAEPGPVVLVGHSMGAQWVVEGALVRPEGVQAVVTIGPVADDRHRTLPAQAWGLAVDTWGESPLANAIVFTDYLRCGVRWYLTQARHMLRYPIERRVAALGVPLVVLRGGKDPIAGRDWCRRIRDAAGDGVLIEVPRRHHVVQHSAPRAVASAIIASTTARPAAPLAGRRSAEVMAS